MISRCACLFVRTAAVVSFVASLLTVIREQASLTDQFRMKGGGENHDWLSVVMHQQQQQQHHHEPRTIKQETTTTTKSAAEEGTAQGGDHTKNTTTTKQARIEARNKPKQEDAISSSSSRLLPVKKSPHENGYREPLAELLQHVLSAGHNNNNNNDTTVAEFHSSLPLPFKVMEQYKRRHSADAVRKNPHHRQYALGFYSCPYSAGNRLHEFFNDLLFSVLLNRTLLWKYPDNNVTCRQYGLRCEIVNKVEDCDQMLARAPWIPSFDEFAPMLGLDRLKGRLLPAVRSFDAQRKQAMRKNKKLTNLSSNDFYKGQYKHLSAVGKKKSPVQLAIYGRDFLDLDWLGDEDRVKLPNAWAVQQAKKLYSFGQSFLYGMLHRYSFDFSKRIQESLPAVNQSSAYTIAVHSRHPNDIDKRLPSCDVSRETKCVKQLLQQQQLLYPKGQVNNTADESPCTVFVLTDRECTLDKMREWLEANTPCEVQIAPHEKGVGSHGEHGPFAGAGYFQDLAFASSGARHAMVASGGFARKLRTSSMTLFELIEYHRIMEKWKANGLGQDYSRMGNVSLCILPMHNVI